MLYLRLLSSYRAPGCAGTLRRWLPMGSKGNEVHDEDNDSNSRSNSADRSRRYTKNKDGVVVVVIITKTAVVVAVIMRNGSKGRNGRRRGCSLDRMIFDRMMFEYSMGRHSAQ